MVHVLSPTTRRYRMRVWDARRAWARRRAGVGAPALAYGLRADGWWRWGWFVAERVEDDDGALPDAVVEHEGRAWTERRALRAAERKAAGLPDRADIYGSPGLAHLGDLLTLLACMAVGAALACAVLAVVGVVMHRDVMAYPAGALFVLFATVAAVAVAADETLRARAARR